MERSTEEFNQLRDEYYKLTTGSSQEAVWIKKLRNILNNDIHGKSLGCYVANTHIKIGDLHLGAFFEAQLLFSHAKWVQRFSGWLAEKLPTSPTLIVGYETYIEPVLVSLSNLRRNVQYCIYEEPKYTQRDQISLERVRSFDEVCAPQKLAKYGCVVFLCGIASSLSTHEKMRNYLYRNITSYAPPSERYISIVQVLPDFKLTNKKNNGQTGNEQIFQLKNAKLIWNKKNKQVKRKTENVEIVCDYLVDVDCEMYLASECKWCFPESIEQERPLIRTEDVSVIPTQMIGSAGEKTSSHNYTIKKFDFFEKDKNNNFKYQQFLRYNHIDRGDHHFLYYIRTRLLLQYLLENCKKAFMNRCQEIRTSFSISENDNINIIIAPLHFSNSRFVQEINKYVFNNTAHAITFDPKKEFRSNFEVKHSNYAYALKQIPAKSESQVRFFFVDDEIITGNTFYRAKSFTTSLMRKYEENHAEKYQVFSGVITLIDRTSESRKYNYVHNLDNIYSFFHFFVPSIRNYGDSCPLCRQISDANSIFENCTLNSTAQYWQEKKRYLQVKTVDDARIIAEREKNMREKNPMLPDFSKRHFIRFYCENLIWENTKGKWEEEEFYDAICKAIYKALSKLDMEEQYEYLISFLKVISRPFLYYKENEKKATMCILHSLLKIILEHKLNEAQLVPCEMIWNICRTHDFAHNKKSVTELCQDKYIFEMYSLLSILITCLSNIESNYLLNVFRLDNLCVYVGALDSSLLRFNSTNYSREETQGFYSIIINNFKKVVSGISGAEKSNRIDSELLARLEWGDYRELYKALYLENVQQSAETIQFGETINSIAKRYIQENMVIEKYSSISEELCKGKVDTDAYVKCDFYMSYDSSLTKDIGDEQIQLPYELIYLSQGAPFVNTRQLFLEAGMSEEAYESELRNAEDALQHIGCYEYNYQLFWVAFQHRIKKSNGMNKTENVFLRLWFSESKLENYKTVRNILIQRKNIYNIIHADLETGALDSDIRAKAAKHILETDKTESHGQSNDINRLFGVAHKLFEHTKNQKANSSDYEKNMCEAYGVINLFINRCIAFGSTKDIVQSYFQFNTNSFMTPFSSSIQKSSNPAHITQDVIMYFQLVKKKIYLEGVLRDINRKKGSCSPAYDSSVMNKTITISYQLDNLEKLFYVPYFINMSDTKRDTAIYLIGVLDTLIRNAIEHSGQECKINVSYQCGEQTVPQELKEEGETYSQSYSFTVKNLMPSGSNGNGNGLTKRFFTNYLSKQRQPGDNFFVIYMKQIQENGISYYQASLICVVKDFAM